jgi:phosphoribosyl 1,2-cyclic phosphate phosphodiesterase
MMRVTFLGTATSSGVPVPTCDCLVCTSNDPRDTRLRPSVLLEWDGASILIDTSTDLREQALRHPIRRIDAVLYTHHHADHVLGLDELRIFNWRQRGPIPVYGSEGTLSRVSKVFWYVFDEVETQSTKPAIERHAVDGPFELAGRRVTPVPVLHGDLPIYGYRVGRFAYLTDVSEIPDASLELLEGLDVLVLSALRRRPHPTHMHLDRAIEEARRVGAHRTLFTHMSHEVQHAPTDDELPPGIELAYDRLSIEVDEGPEELP